MRTLLSCGLMLILLSSCGQPEENGTIVLEDSVETLDPFRIPSLDSAVIYCWCFSNGQSSCMTFAAVKPEAICDTGNRLLAISGFEHLPGFETLLKSAQLRKNKWGTRDARFVVKCFTKDTSFLLTYADYDDSTFWIDNDRELKCKRPILAWIMSEMDLKEIDCPD